jgi:hypothetical protein
MHCTLLIPDLFWPPDTAGQVVHGVELPALARFASRAKAERYPRTSADVWLCRAFEVERQQDWPIAPLTLAADGGDPGMGYCLRAAPVHNTVERDRVTLIDNDLFDVTLDEARELASALTAHFAEERLGIEARAPTRWYAKLPRTPALVTKPLSEAAGKDVQRSLPSGADALQWHRRFNEAQMVLHAHAVNEAREARGEPAVNSVWFWGGGTRVPVRGRHFSAVWSDHPLAIALAAAADIHADRVPADAQAFMAAAGQAAVDPDRSHLVMLDALTSALRYRDIDAWRSRAVDIERKWLAPLFDALRGGRLAKLTLVSPGKASCWRFEATRRDLLRFWRRARPLASYA